LNRKEKVKKLEKEFHELVKKFTPDKIKNSPIIDLNEKKEIKLLLTRRLVKKWELEEWLKNYRKEAVVSTSGIRGTQNVLYPWDYRFPLNEIGITLATLAKATILNNKMKDKNLHKITAGEVRYNTKEYIELISRIQAALGINIHLPFNNDTTPIWMVSFIIFLFDYDGGEYVTASHSVSTKTATKDLNNQGKQFTPEELLMFVDEIEKIIKKSKKPKGFTINISAKNNPLIVEDFDGIDLYVNYLRKDVIKEVDIEAIQRAVKNGMKITFENVGGCAYRTMSKIFQRLNIEETFEWNNREEDPFFHGIGKIRRLNPKTGKMEFFDMSCDSCLPEVVKTMGYEELLKDKPIGHLVMITDPDADRLVIGQVEPIEKIKKLENLGINYLKIDKNKIFTVYHPTYSFLMTMDFRMKQLKESRLWNNHPRFIIKTTASSYAWDEWALANGIKVINTPVGFPKEIAAIMIKIENQMIENSNREITIKDVYENDIKIGKQPRLVFAGEESGGMITGPEDLIISKSGRFAISMREKSAGEASVIVTSMAAHLFNKKQLLSDYLGEILNENKIKYKYFLNGYITYYNESEPNPKKLLKEKASGEIIRDKSDKFYLGLALGIKMKIIDIRQAKLILSEAFSDLDFSDLEDIIFVGDGTYLKFKDMFVEIRKSGTDAILKAYSCGCDKKKCEIFLKRLLNYNGKLTNTYKKLIPSKFFNNLYNISRKIYLDYFHEGL
jgi:phosphomannomutase